jgi:uncharacterized protein YjbI with pentapeptide repeats
MMNLSKFFFLTLISIPLFIVSYNFPSSKLSYFKYHHKSSSRHLFQGEDSKQLVRKPVQIFVILSSIISATVLSVNAVEQQQYKLPPIDYKDLNRCVFTSSNMGQANAVPSCTIITCIFNKYHNVRYSKARDKLYDLRECDLRGQSAAGKDLSGVIGGDADFSKVDFKETQLSK